MSLSCGTPLRASGPSIDARAARPPRKVPVQIHFRNDWHKTLRKIVSNPTLEVVAAIVLVLIAAWVVIGTEAEHHAAPLFPLLFGHR